MTENNDTLTFAGVCVASHGLDPQQDFQRGLVDAVFLQQPLFARLLAILLDQPLLALRHRPDVAIHVQAAADRIRGVGHGRHHQRDVHGSPVDFVRDRHRAGEFFEHRAFDAVKAVRVGQQVGQNIGNEMSVGIERERVKHLYMEMKL